MKIYVNNQELKVSQISNNHHSLDCIINKHFEQDIDQLTTSDLKNIYGKFLDFERLVLNIRSPKQINFISKQIIKDFNNSNNLRLSISELLMNSLEHGSLHISSNTKNEMIADGIYYDILEHLVKTNTEKFITLEYKFTAPRHIIITDKGKGFNYKSYLKNAENPDSSAYSGRGISIVLKELPKESAKFEYQENGKKIVISFDQKS